MDGAAALRHITAARMRKGRKQVVHGAGLKVKRELESSWSAALGVALPPISPHGTPYLFCRRVDIVASALRQRGISVPDSPVPDWPVPGEKLAATYGSWLTTEQLKAWYDFVLERYDWPRPRTMQEVQELADELFSAAGSFATLLHQKQRHAAQPRPPEEGVRRVRREARAALVREPGMGREGGEGGLGGTMSFDDMLMLRQRF